MARMLTSLQAHPGIVAVFVVCIVIGIVLGLNLFPESWPLWRKLAGGMISGAGVGLMITAPRIVGPAGG